jgi:hypothetical protein
MLEVEKYRPASEERFKVPVYLVREEFFKLPKQTGLAARPFEKRLRFDLARHDERHGDLFVFQQRIAFGPVEQGGGNFAADFVLNLRIGFRIRPLSPGS